MRAYFLATFLLLGFPANAQGFEPESVGHWNIWENRFNGCIAFNRPISEIDFAFGSGVYPTNALGFFAISREEIGMLIYLWPGVNIGTGPDSFEVDVGQGRKLTLATGDGAGVAHGVAAALSSDTIEVLNGEVGGSGYEGMILVNTKSPAITAFFDVSDAPSVLEALERCVEKTTQ